MRLEALKAFVPLVAVPLTHHHWTETESVASGGTDSGGAGVRAVAPRRAVPAAGVAARTANTGAGPTTMTFEAVAAAEAATEIDVATVQKTATIEERTAETTVKMTIQAAGCPVVRRGPVLSLAAVVLAPIGDGRPVDPRRVSTADTAGGSPCRCATGSADSWICTQFGISQAFRQKMSAYGHQAGRIIVHCTDGSCGLISHPSSEVHGPRLALRGDRGGIGSRNMYSFAGSGASVTGFGWTGELVCTVIGTSDGAGSTRMGSVMSAQGSRLDGAGPSGADGVVFTIRLNTAHHKVVQTGKLGSTECGQGGRDRLIGMA